VPTLEEEAAIEGQGAESMGFLFGFPGKSSMPHAGDRCCGMKCARRSQGTSVTIAIGTDVPAPPSKGRVVDCTHHGVDAPIRACWNCDETNTVVAKSRRPAPSPTDHSRCTVPRHAHPTARRLWVTDETAPRAQSAVTVGARMCGEAGTPTEVRPWAHHGRARPPCSCCS